MPSEALQRAGACSRASLFFAAVTGVLAMWPSDTHATVVRAMSLLEKTESSPVVVHGRVERVEVEWEVPGSKVQSLVIVKIVESIKGDFAPGERLILRHGGGTIGAFAQTISGMSTYDAGEEVVLFLEPLGPHYVEIGVGIGKYAVEPHGTDKRVTHAPMVAAVRFQGDRPVSIEPVVPMTPEPLATFLKRVRSYARAIPTEPTAMPRKGAVLKAPLAIPPR